MILKLSLVLAAILCAAIGTLVIVDVFSTEQAKDYLVKSLGVIALLGVSSALISLVAGNRDTNND